MQRIHLRSCLVAAWLAIGCATPRSPPPPAASPPSASNLYVEGEAAPETEPGAVACKLRCEAPRMIPRVGPERDYTQREVDNATTVLTAMNGDLLACYKQRLRVNPKAHGYITADILVGSDGRVGKVGRTGGAILGDKTMACIVHRIQQGVFEPPHAGGNIHVQVPFSLEVVAADDET
jgi:hypothetical protein